MMEAGKWRQLTAMIIVAVATIALPSFLPSGHALPIIGQVLVGLMISLLAFSATNPVSRVYKALVILGAILLLAGNTLSVFFFESVIQQVCLMLLGNSLLLAAFFSQSSLFRSQTPVFVYTILITVLLFVVLPVLGGLLKYSVIALLVSAGMAAAQSASWAVQHPNIQSARMAATGAGLIVCSHTSFVIDAFISPISWNRAAVLIPLWVGVAVVSLSITAPSRYIRMPVN